MPKQPLTLNLASYLLEKLFEDIYTELEKEVRPEFPYNSKDIAGRVVAKCAAKYKDCTFGYWFNKDDILCTIADMYGYEIGILEEIESFDDICFDIASYIDDHFDAEFGVCWHTIQCAVEEHEAQIKSLIEVPNT